MVNVIFDVRKNERLKLCCLVYLLFSISPFCFFSIDVDEEEGIFTRGSKGWHTEVVVVFGLCKIKHF